MDCPRNLKHLIRLSPFPLSLPVFCRCFSCSSECLRSSAAGRRSRRRRAAGGRGGGTRCGTEYPAGI